MLQAEAQQYETKLAGLGQAERKQPTVGRFKTKQAGEAIQDDSLDGHHAECQADHSGEVGEQDAEINAGAHGDEEQAKQQALEGFDVRFELMAEFAIGQDDTGEEGAQCRRKVHQRHQQCDTDHQQQRAGGEDLA